MKTIYDDIKIGDTVGKPNFPHVIGVVIKKNSKGFLVELPIRQGSKGKKQQMIVYKKDVEKGLYGKIDIQEGEIAEEKKLTEIGIDGQSA